jgi:hypothetical protein
MSSQPLIAKPADTVKRISAVDIIKKSNPSRYSSLSEVSFMAVLYFGYSSYLVYYDIYNMKNPLTNNKIEIGRYVLNLVFIMSSLYVLKNTEIPFNTALTCKYTGSMSNPCSPFTFSIKYLLCLFFIVYFYDFIITLLVYHKFITDTVLIKKLKIGCIISNLLVALFSLNYVREFISN